MTTDELEIRGMTCDHCKGTVTKALEAIEGIREVTVDVAAGRARFVSDAPVDPEVVRAAVRTAGYEPVG